MVLNERAQPAQVVRSNLAGRLCLDGYAHFADNEVYLDSARQPPIAQLFKGIAETPPSADLVEHPVLERLAVQLGTLTQWAAAR